MIMVIMGLVALIVLIAVVPMGFLEKKEDKQAEIDDRLHRLAVAGCEIRKLWVEHEEEYGAIVLTADPKNCVWRASVRYTDITHHHQGAFYEVFRSGTVEQQAKVFVKNFVYNLKDSI